MNDQRGNLYENKGPVFHRRMRSGNVIENKDSYEFKSGMLLKKQHVRFLPPNAVRVVAQFLRYRPFRLSTFDCLRKDTESKRGGRAVAVSPEALAMPQLDAEDSILVANAEQRNVFSERPFKLDDLVL